MSVPYITKRYASLNMAGVTNPTLLVEEFTKCVGLVEAAAKREDLEPIWRDAIIGSAPEDAMLGFTDDPEGTYVTVPMIGRRD